MVLKKAEDLPPTANAVLGRHKTIPTLDIDNPNYALFSKLPEPYEIV